MKRFLASLATFSLVFALVTFVLIELAGPPAVASLLLLGVGGAGQGTVVISLQFNASANSQYLL
jgi:hypothetical protein